ncbi:piggyBac transposable element-derived protein 4-like [Uloborus diversus]|uniref:piggyBac transposable element-derived protein 4-like n=1 Tax=Uloborus diversus TaxID=327109 RepID=UPI00240A7B7D|nr:piggyBac transposable element-derived protein 4-like [Uloborus diversus]
MYRRKGLSEEEIEKLMNDLDSENYADSDSHCLEENDISLLEESFNGNESLNTTNTSNDENNLPNTNAADKKFIWKVPAETDEIQVHAFTGKNGVKSGAEPGLKREIDYLQVFLSEALTTLLCDETNRYRNQTTAAISSILSKKRKHAPDWTAVTTEEINVFFGLVLLMGHIYKDSISDYWSNDELIDTPIFRKAMTRDRFLEILKYLHFENNESKPGKNSSYDRLWKIRKVFELLNNAFKSVYDPTEQLAIDEVIVKFKGKVLFRQYIPNKRKQWGIKMYKISDKNGYTYDMNVYLGKDQENKKLSASHNVVTKMAQCVKNRGHKLYMDIFFSSPELFLELHEDFKINSCGTIRKNRKSFPKEVSKKKMQKGEIVSRYSLGTTALCWRDKREVYMLSNMHKPPTNNELIGNNSKPEIIKDYNENMGFVDLSDRMANSYTFGRRSLKWTKKLFFHLLDLSVLNAYILYKLNHPQEKHKDFRMKLIRQMIAANGSKLEKKVERVNKFPRLDMMSHWSSDEKKRRRCGMCAKKNIQKRSTIVCKACNVALCVDQNCFEEYHLSMQQLNA